MQIERAHSYNFMSDFSVHKATCIAMQSLRLFTLCWLGLVYPGVGWVVWRSKEYLPESMVFHTSRTLNQKTLLYLHTSNFEEASANTQISISCCGHCMQVCFTKDVGQNGGSLFRGLMLRPIYDTRTPKQHRHTSLSDSKSPTLNVSAISRDCWWAGVLVLFLYLLRFPRLTTRIHAEIRHLHIFIRYTFSKGTSVGIGALTRLSLTKHSTLAEYLGSDQPNFTLNFSKSASMIIGQYYQFVRLGFEGYKKIMASLLNVTLRLQEGIQKLGMNQIWTHQCQVCLRSFDIIIGNWAEINGVFHQKSLTMHASHRYASFQQCITASHSSMWGHKHLLQQKSFGFRNCLESLTQHWAM